MLLAVTGHKIEQVFIPLFSAKSKIVSPLIYFLYQYQSGLSFLKSKTVLFITPWFLGYFPVTIVAWDGYVKDG